MKQWNVAILGTGAIAAVMADTLNGMEEARLYAVGSRTLDRARAFAEKYGAEKACGNYEELVADPQVELVYIATPHSEHWANALLCIRAGKPVLCEKAFTANAAQAREVFAEAERRGVFITEAIWTRYMPMLATIREEMNSGSIGQVRMLTGNLGYSIADVPRLRGPKLAGGALLDVGVYPLNFALALFGHGYDRVESSCSKLPTGVDAQNSVTLYYPDGRVAQLNSSLEACLDRQGVIHGTKGYIRIENINNFESLSVYDGQHRLVRRVERPTQITGYEYEVRACLRALEAGELSCPEMPHEESVRVMELMDSLRAAWGVRYPFE